MRVYEAIVKGLEGIGVRAAFGGAGENAAGLMLALKHSPTIRPIITRHEQAASFMACGHAMYTDELGLLLRDRRSGGVQPVLGPGRGDVGLLPGARGLRVRPDGVEGPGLAQRDLGMEPDPELARHVRRDHQGVVPDHPDRRHLRHPRGSRQPRLRRAAGAGAHHGAGEPDPPADERGQLPRHRARRAARRPGPGRRSRLPRRRWPPRCRAARRSSCWPGSEPSAATRRRRSSGSSSASRSRS